MALTVTATQTGADVFNGMQLSVLVLTGAAAAASQTGATGTAVAPAVSVTTTVTGSLVAGAMSDPNAGLTYTALGSTTTVENLNDTTNGATYIAWKASAATGTPGATSFGYTGGPGDGSEANAAAEILAAGTIAQDASTPAPATTTSATTVTTASFTPPPGSLLVALVSSDSNAVASFGLSVTGTGGVTFTQRVLKLGGAFGGAGVWVADVPSSSSPGAQPQPGGPAFRRLHRKRQQLVQVPPAAAVAVTDSDSCAGADAGERVTVLASDACTGADSQSIAASLSSSDASAGTDAGEIVKPEDSDGSSGSDGSHTGISDSDATTGADSQSLTANVPSSDASSGAEAQHVGVSSADASGGADSSFITASLSDSDVAHGTDAGESIGTSGTPHDSDSCLGYDSGFSFMSDSDGCAGTDGQLFRFALSDACSGSERELTAWPGDSESVRGTDSTGSWYTVATGASDSDACTGTDSAPHPLFPASDFTESCTAIEAQVIDVYTYQPLFRWTGGQFEVVFRGNAIWSGRQPGKPQLELAALLASGSAEVLSDGDSCSAREDEQEAPQVTLMLTSALEVTLGLRQAE